MLRPKSIDEIVDLVMQARSSKMQIRVCGSAHSVPHVIHTDEFLQGRSKGSLDLLLDHLDEIKIDPQTGKISVGSGVKIGFDPRDITGKSKTENGLAWNLDRAGWALPNLTGISHQTVAGAMLTGSEGGSAVHSFLNCVTGIKLIDGTGRVQDFDVSKNPELFHAVAVSFGLMGIIVEVRLQGVRRYDVGGEEVTLSRSSALNGLLKGEMSSYLRHIEYGRILWWPQLGIDRFSVLKMARAEPLLPAEANQQSYTPLQSYPSVMGSTLPFQWLGSLFMDALGNSQSNWLRDQLRNWVLNVLVPVRKSVFFRDIWWRGLPMDDEIDERLLPTTFTEAWIPLDRANEAMERLRSAFKNKKCPTGDYAIEFYAAAPTKAWMSPGYQRQSLRINLFWYKRNKQDPTKTLFPVFWAALADLEPRYHWAKISPYPSEITVQKLAAKYPQWDEFLKLRFQFDPDHIFLTDAWSLRLGLPRQKVGDPFLPLPKGNPMTHKTSTRFKWPLTSNQRSVGLDFIETSDFKIDLRIELPVSREKAFSAIAKFDEIVHWVPGGLRVEWLNGRENAQEAIFDEILNFVTFRWRMKSYEFPQHMALQLDSVSLPLVDGLLEAFDFRSLSTDRTELRWQIAFSINPYFRPFVSLLKKVAEIWLMRALKNFRNYLAKDVRHV